MEALPILAMTANAYGDDRDACLAAGMNDHVAKPVDPQHLYRAVLRWLLAGRAVQIEAMGDQAAHAVTVASVAAAGEPPPTDKQTLVQALDHLDSLFVQADFDAVRALRLLAPVLRVHDAARVVTLETQLRAYDFEGALVTLETWRARLLMPS
jgi:CheY-like chemotaxis protein